MMRRAWWVVLMLAVVIGSQWMIVRSHGDVRVARVTLAGTPTLHFGAVGNPQGAVLVAHGFGGSKELMQYWGYALARQGFDAYLLDQPGHGAQEVRLPEWHGLVGNPLGANLSQAVDELVASGRAEPGRIGLIGHSMGGVAALAAALEQRAVGATVTISSAHGDAIPSDRPANLLALVAQRDPDSIRAMAATIVPAEGRSVVTIAGRNHLTILFDRGAMGAAVDWLHRSLGTEPRGAVELPLPIVWLPLALAAGVGALLAVAGLVRPPVARTSAKQRPIGLAAGLVAVAVALLSAVLAVVYWRVPQLGVAVLDYLLPYFLVAAAVLLLLRTLWPREFAVPLLYGSEGALAALLRGVAVALAYLGALVPVIHMNLTHHLPNPPRILPLAVAIVVFWLYSVQEEGLKRAVAGGPSLGGFLLGVSAKLLIVGTWLGATALPDPPVFLNMTIPVTLTLLIAVEVVGQFMAALRFSSVSIATVEAFILGWATAVTFPLV